MTGSIKFDLVNSVPYPNRTYNRRVLVGLKIKTKGIPLAAPICLVYLGPFHLVNRKVGFSTMIIRVCRFQVIEIWQILLLTILQKAQVVN